ncbi:MAG: polysaccharide biosynthesis tyrosine autokinase, partial [Planctomycetota bacterium]
SLVAGAAIHMALPPIYESRAEILLIKQISEADSEDLVAGEVNIEDDLNTQMTIFRSLRVVSDAVQDHQLDQLPTIQELEEGASVVSYIIDHLSAIRGGTREFPDPNVMHVAYEGPNPEDCETILAAVIQSYQEFLGETYQSFGARTLAQVTEAKDVLDEKLREKKEEYREFRRNAPVMILSQSGDETSVNQLRLSDLENHRAEASQRISELESSIAEVETALARGVSSDAVALMINRFQPQQTRTSTTASLRQQLEATLIEAIVEEQILSDLGAEHPDVRAARQRVELIQTRLDQLPEEEEPATSEEQIGVYLDALKHELAMLRSQRGDLEQQFAREEAKVRAIREYLERDLEYRKELDNRQALFDTMLEQLEKASLVKDYSGISAQLISTPDVGTRIAPTIPKSALIALASGIVLGLLAIWLLEVWDQRFASPDELRGHLGLPVLGHIPLMSNESRRYARLAREKLPHDVDESLCTFYQPAAPISEAYRGLRTLIHFDSRNNDNRLLQVTSALPGDGKTTVAANLGVTLAQSGKRVVLVDADLRKPRLGSVFGIEAVEGTSTILQGTCKPKDAVVATAVDNLWVLPCGTPPANPSELLMSARFKRLLEELRGSCDLVIVDSPPMVPVTDSSLIAPLVDAVLLTVKLSNEARGMARDAVETLREVNATVLGVVVNGVSPRGAGYRQHRSYQYSDRYAASYGNAAGHRNDLNGHSQPAGLAGRN